MAKFHGQQYTTNGWVDWSGVIPPSQMPMMTQRARELASRRKEGPRAPLPEEYSQAYGEMVSLIGKLVPGATRYIERVEFESWEVAEGVVSRSTSSTTEFSATIRADDGLSRSSA
jgi:hypothetical protein